MTAALLSPDSVTANTVVTANERVDEDPGDKAGNGCPGGMTRIDTFCIDRYEASTEEVLEGGTTREVSPFESVASRNVRAVSRAHVVPQAYISGDEAQAACGRAGKRLCKPKEWQKACVGPSRKTFGYGGEREAGRCNDHGRSPMGLLYPPKNDVNERSRWSWANMNDPALNQIPGTLSPTGAHEACTNEYGVYDMVGNLHEWVDDPAGTFQGGYYLDTHQNGDGCAYRTMAHETWYHDYSTGFRCCL